MKDSLEALMKLVKSSCPNKTSCDKCDFEKACNSFAKGWIDTIKQDLERLEKLEEEYNNLKKGIKIFLEYYDVYLFDEDGLGSCEIGVATIGEDFYISKEKYLLLKEVFEK